MANEVTFKIDGDKVVRYIPLSQFGQGIYQIDVVMDKEIFIECFKKWITESEDKNE